MGYLCPTSSYYKKRSSLKCPGVSHYYLHINKFICLLIRAYPRQQIGPAKGDAWPSSNQPQQSHKIILTRLRIGHTRLTHTPLMPLSYPHCDNDTPSTVDHLFNPKFTTHPPQLNSCTHRSIMSSLIPTHQLPRTKLIIVSRVAKLLVQQMDRRLAAR